MTSILPPKLELEHRRQRAVVATQVLAVAIMTMQLDIDLISTLTVTGATDLAGDTLLPDIALAVLEFRETLDALPWPDDEAHS